MKLDVTLIDILSHCQKIKAKAAKEGASIQEAFEKRRAEAITIRANRIVRDLVYLIYSDLKKNPFIKEHKQIFGCTYFIFSHYDFAINLSIPIIEEITALLKDYNIEIVSMGRGSANTNLPNSVKVTIPDQTKIAYDIADIKPFYYTITVKLLTPTKDEL